MKILITGKTGQLGRSLINIKPQNCEIIAPEKSELNLLNPKECEDIIKKMSPDWVINCGAFTNVDYAESKKNITMKINAEAPNLFAKAIKKQGGHLIQISSDYVFDGAKRIGSYKIEDKRNPQNVYGYSKLRAEESIENILGGTKKGIILRTSWLISPYGKNFVLKMLKLFTSKNELKVISDQIGSPTSAEGLAEVCWKIINLKNKALIFKNNPNGILHWSDNGQTSWFELAKTIRDLSLEIGLLKKNIRLIPIKTSDYISQAKRPNYSVLDSRNTKKILNINGNDWRKNLKDILKKILVTRKSHKL